MESDTPWVDDHIKTAYSNDPEDMDDVGWDYVYPEDARTLERRLREAIPFSEIENQIDHIQQNGIDLKKYGGENEHEGRCRELCAMYLREFILTRTLGLKIEDAHLKECERRNRQARRLK